MSGTLNYARAIAQATREINAPHDVEAILHAIVGTAARSLDGIDLAGVSVVHRDGTVETQAGNDPLEWEIDKIQYDLGEGPCLDAILSDHPVVVVNDLGNDPRWPGFAPQAHARGIRSQIGLRLWVDDQNLGGLNLYSTSTDTIDPDVEYAAEIFAVNAALALGRARQVDELSKAMASRRVIGQAVGVVMERYHLDEQHAFGYLTRVSQHTNRKLRDVAQGLVDEFSSPRNELDDW
jgi:GAF domain-containing protein